MLQYLRIKNSRYDFNISIPMIRGILFLSLLFRTLVLPKFYYLGKSATCVTGCPTKYHQIKYFLTFRFVCVLSIENVFLIFVCNCEARQGRPSFLRRGVSKPEGKGKLTFILFEIYLMALNNVLRWILKKNLPH